MKKTLIVSILGLTLVILIAASCSAAVDTSESKITGRYQIFSAQGTTQPLIVMLDTKSGKIWQLTMDVTGKLKVEGVTVEGLAFSSKETEFMKHTIDTINLEKVSETHRKAVRDELAAAFSYQMDKDTIENILLPYMKKKD